MIAHCASYVDCFVSFRHHIVEEIASAVADTDLSGSNLSPRTFNTTASTTPSISVEPSSPTEPREDESQSLPKQGVTPQESKRYTANRPS